MGYAPPTPPMPPRRIMPPNAGSASWLANHPNGPLAQAAGKPPAPPGVPPGWPGGSSPGLGTKPPDPSMGYKPLDSGYQPPGKPLDPNYQGDQYGLPTGAGTLPPGPTYPPTKPPDPTYTTSGGTTAPPVTDPNSPYGQWLATHPPTPTDFGTPGGSAATSRPGFSGSTYRSTYTPPANVGDPRANNPGTIGSHVNAQGQTVLNQGGQANRAAMSEGLLGNMGQQTAPGGETWDTYMGGENMQGLTVDPRMFHPNSPFAQRAASEYNPNWGQQPLRTGPGPNANAQHQAFWNDPMTGMLAQRQLTYDMFNNLPGASPGGDPSLVGTQDYYTGLMGLGDRPHPVMDQWFADRGIQDVPKPYDRVTIDGVEMARSTAEAQGLMPPTDYTGTNNAPGYIPPEGFGGYKSYGEMLLGQSRAAGFPNAPSGEPTGPDLSYQGETPDQEAGNPGGANSGYNGGGGMSIEPWLMGGPGYLPYNPQEGDQQYHSPPLPPTPAPGDGDYHDGLPPYGPPRRKPVSAFDPSDPSTYGNHGPLDPDSLAGGRRRMRATGR